MFANLLKRRAPVQAPVSPRVPGDSIVWAIGDIHGRLDLLTPFVDAIRADVAASDGARSTVVFLGDYIDRGPESRQVIQFLIDLPTDGAIEWRFLKGNHEEAMLDFLEDPAQGAKWCEYGGDATLASYGLRVPRLTHQAEAWTHLSADLDHKLTAEERGFLQDLEISITIGDYFFAHAGARPGLSLENQASHDLMWIRRSFLDSEVQFDKIVVHGHTPTVDVHIDGRRVGLDTKAYETGRLSGLRLRNSERRLLVCDNGTVVSSPL